MKILQSALACSPEFGSEALVAYRLIATASQHFESEAITSAGMSVPDVVNGHQINVRFSDPNDVSPMQLLRFELKQRALARRLLRRGSFDLLHRVTPSGHKASLLERSRIPLILGPVLGSDPPPQSFQAVFQPALPRCYSPRTIANRIGNGLARRVFRRFSTSERLLDEAAAILVGTDVTRRRLPERLHARCRLVTYAGVEYDRFTPPSARRPSRVLKLLFVGRIVPYKGVELLLRAVAVARRALPLQLTIVGGGDRAYQLYCRRLAADLKLDDSVMFIDHVPRESLVDMYRSADVFCMPSIETYGIAILEAMSCGCAVLVADYNGPGEIVQSATGLKVPLRAPQQFIDDYSGRIVELAQNLPLRNQLGASAREHVVRCHDWKRIELSWLEVYDEICPREAN